MNPSRALRLIIFAVCVVSGTERIEGASIGPPQPGRFYHGFYFSRNSDTEHDSNAKDVEKYEQAAGAGTTWVFFSDFWCESRAFPSAMCQWIHDLGKIPYVRLMLRSDFAQDHAEKTFTLDAIIAGKFDADLGNWAAGARKFGAPMLVEWGTECNGEWFAWNGKWNGNAGGPAKFVQAWRHIVKLMRDAGCDNITWVWHVNDSDVPEVGWNRLENYYPGDDYVDWVAVSAYGFLKPHEEGEPERLRDLLDAVVPRLETLAPAKPLILAEFGCAEHHPKISAAAWAKDALTDILSNRWPGIRGFCWWNETWQNDDQKKHDTDMIIMDDTALAEVFQTQLSAAKEKIQEKAVLQMPGGK
ncbi:MAG: glycosyl hydrolase [Chthoniobacteraceae bacterium]